MGKKRRATKVMRRFWAMLLVAAMMVTMLPQDVLYVHAAENAEDFRGGTDTQPGEPFSESQTQTDDTLSGETTERESLEETEAEDVIPAEETDGFTADTADSAEEIDSLTADTADSAEEIDSLTADTADSAEGIDGLTADLADTADTWWNITDGGKLTVNRDGEILGDDGKGSVPWAGRESEIKTAEITVSGATSLKGLFKGCNYLTSVAFLSGTDMSTVTDMSEMFSDCWALQSLDMSNMTVSKVTDMSLMFNECHDLETLYISNWSTDSLANTSRMFYRCGKLKALDIGGWKTGNITDMSNMFFACDELEALALDKWDTGSVTNMSWMFAGCGNLKGLNVSGWNTEHVADMSCLFSQCGSLEKLDLSSWKTTQALSNVEHMFGSCSLLTELNLSGFDFGGITNSYFEMLYGCQKLVSIENPLNVSVPIPLPVKDDTCSWRKPDGNAVNNLVQKLSETTTLTCNRMAGIGFKGTRNHLLKDDEGKELELVDSKDASEAYGEKIVEIGSKESFTFTVVPNPGYVVKSVSLTSGSGESAINLEKGSRENQYIVSPKDLETGYTRDERITVEVVPVQNVTITVSYDEDILDAIVVNGGTQTKDKPGSAQVSNGEDTVIYVKAKESTDGDLLAPVAYIGSENDGYKVFVPEENSADISDAEKELISQGYYMIRLGGVHENTSVFVSQMYQWAEDDIARGNNQRVSWVIDKNGRLKIKGTGNLPELPVVKEEREKITSAVVDLKGATFIYNIFEGCSNMVSLDLSKLDMKDVTGVYEQFVYYCSSLEEIRTPRNLSADIRVPLPSYYVLGMSTVSWRMQDGTKLDTLPTGLSESITIDTRRVAMVFKGDNFVVKDSSGKVIESKELIVRRGTTDALTFVVEPLAGYVICYPDDFRGDLAISVDRDTSDMTVYRYTISPPNAESGYFKDEYISFKTEAVTSRTLNISYDDKISDAIVADGSAEHKDKPQTVSVTGSNNVSVYVKPNLDSGAGTQKIPMLRYKYYNGNNLQYLEILADNNTAFMSTREKELVEEGYYIFRLGQICINYMDVSVYVRTLYQVQFAAEGFPGRADIVRYLDKGSGGLVRSDVCTSPIMIGSDETLYLKIEYDESAEAGYELCSPKLTADTECMIEYHEEFGGQAGIWSVKPSGNTALKATFEPHEILFLGSASDFVDLAVTGGHVRLSETTWGIEVSGGNDFTISFRLADENISLDRISYSDVSGSVTDIQYTKSDAGVYTFTVQDRDRIASIKNIQFVTSDKLNRVDLSDPDVQFRTLFVERVNVVKGMYSCIYTGAPIEPKVSKATIWNPEISKKAVTLAATDYTIEYADNVNAGTAAIIMSAAKDSTKIRGSRIIPFEITKAPAPAKGLSSIIQVEAENAGQTQQADLAELFKIETKIEKDIKPATYRLETGGCSYGAVLEGAPTLEGNILTYTTRKDANKTSEPATLVIYATFRNYADARLELTVRVIQKQTIVLGGNITLPDKVYDGAEASTSVDGLTVVSREGAPVAGADAEALFSEIKDSLIFHYTGVAPTVYDSDTPPVDVGTYKIVAAVSPFHLDYKSDSYELGTFAITKRSIEIAAQDSRLYVGDTKPDAWQFVYRINQDGLAQGHALNPEPVITCPTLDMNLIGEYAVNVNVAGVRICDAEERDVTANYIISGRDAVLEVAPPEPGSYTITYNLMGHGENIIRSGMESGKLLTRPENPVADGYVFLGWYKDAGLSKLWDFGADIVQGDITLYAGWAPRAEATTGITLCIQKIPSQTYTGKAIKPVVAVYAEDGVTLLKPGRDYSVTYQNNILADTARSFGQDETPDGGVGANANDTSNGFSQELAYVVITGKGNYTGTVYANFHILPANITASGTVLKYTDQFNEKAGSYASIVKQLKCNGKALAYNKDYTLTVKRADGGADETAAVSLNTKGQLPLNSGTYQVTIAGKDNFAGEIVKTLYVADKAVLLNNAKITLKSTISDVTKEQLAAGVQPQNLVVKMNGTTLTQGTDYVFECVDNHAVGTATVIVRPGEGSKYIGSKTKTFKIKGGSFKANAVIISDWKNTMPYTGEALTQNGVSLKTKDGKELVYGTDYVVSYKNNIKKGTATATFTAQASSGYSGRFSKKFKIMPLDLGSGIKDGLIIMTGAEQTGSDWKLMENVSYRKSGVTPADKLTLRLNSTGAALTAVKNKDYSVSYTNNKNVGSACMTLKGKGNFTGQVDIHFDITKASLSKAYRDGEVSITSASIQVSYQHSRYWDDWGDGDGSWEYGDLQDPDREFEPAIMIKDGKTALRKNVDFTVEYEGNTRSALEENGALTARIRGIGNYGSDGDEAIELSVSVNRRTLSAGKVEVDYEDTFTYTGSAIMPQVSEVRYKVSNGKGREDRDDYEPPEWDTLELGTDYRLEYTKNIVKGTGTVKIIGIGKYTGSLSKSFKINAKAIYQAASGEK